MARTPLISALAACVVFVGFLALYTYTAAPSVLSGDSAEFQMAAPLLGVPHPTTYPLYMLLGKLFTLLVPFRDLAGRVTLVSACCAALADALLFLAARRVTGSMGAALVAALALGFAPGLWNTATLAEVYALLLALLAALAALLIADERRTTNDERPGTGARTPNVESRVCAAAFVAGLGFSHHGLFTFTGLPLLGAYIAWRWLCATTDHRPPTTVKQHRVAFLPSHLLTSSPFHRTLPPRHRVIVSSCFVLGLTPWLFPLVQYARYGPFNGVDYGLPRHYFWGAPESWGAAINLLFGGPIRQGIFRVPTLDHVSAVLQLFVSRLGFEFGPLGCALGIVGSVALWRRNRAVWLGAAWIIVGTVLYVVLLGRAVQDADVFTLPTVLPWALWVGVGADAIARRLASDERRTTPGERPPTTSVPQDQTPDPRPQTPSPRGSWFVVLAVGLTVAWGYTRVPYTYKRSLYLFREWGQATLQVLPPRSVVITHWEQGMALQYLVLAERQRPDVFVDVVEPGDENWGERARRYPDRPVFFAGGAADVATLPVTLAEDADYAKVFQLRK